MINRRGIWWVVPAIALWAAAGQVGAAEPDSAARAEAKEPDSAARAEAKQRVAHGTRLFENGDHAGAIAEFERAYELAPTRLLLYRIGLAYAEMEKPIEAVQNLDELLKDPGTLKPEQVARARAAKEEQQHRIGQVDVKTSVPAAIEIDGEKAGDTPFEAPVQVAAGQHVVAAVAAGYLPVRETVTVAGEGRSELVFELKPTESKLAHVTIHCPVPGVEVRLDDVLLGKTPFSAPVTVAPGKLVFEMQRAGYMNARRVLNLAEGVYGAVAFDPEEDESAGADRGRLRLAAGTGDIVVTIDGRARGVYRQPIELPAGPHTVKLERSGFESLERLAEIPAGGEAEVKASLHSTGKTRAAAEASSRSRKRWAIGTMVGGALVAGGSVGLAVWANGKLPPAEDNLAKVKKDAAVGGNGLCDPNNGLSDLQITLCGQQMADAQGPVDRYRNLRLGGIIGAGVGVAVVGVGVALLVTAPSPVVDEQRDDHEGTVAGLVPVLSAGPDGASFGLRGRF